MKELKKALLASKGMEAYDAQAKRLLGNRHIVAHILVNTLEEYKGMDPKEVANLIEGEIHTDMVPIEAGLTNDFFADAKIKNKFGDRIIELKNECGDINEGVIVFDIIFYIRKKDGLTKMIINIEAQKDTPTKYKIINRATFYVGRLVSSQKDRDFRNEDYDEMKEVCSIWICMDAKENFQKRMYINDEDIIGKIKLAGNKNIMSMVFVGLNGRIPEKGTEYKLHRLLSVLFSPEMPVKEKLQIFKTEYDIPIEEKTKEDMDTMCDLSEWVLEKGIERGMERGMERGKQQERTGFIMNMHNNGCSLELISAVSNETIDKIKAIIENPVSVGE